MSAGQFPVGGVDGGSVPPPPGWTGRRPAWWTVLLAGYLVVTALGLLAGAAWAFRSGQPLTGALLVAGASYVAHVVGFGACAWWTPRRAGRTGTLTSMDDRTEGVRFGYSVWPYYWLTALLAMTLLGAGVVAVGLASTATVAGAVTAALVALLVLAIGWFLVIALRLAPGALILLPTGVYHAGLTFTHFVPWHAVYQISGDDINTPVIVVKAQPSNDTRVRFYTGRFGTREQRFLPFMVVRTYWLAADPVTVYQVLSFYHRHPELRTELGTPAALERISSGRAVA